MPSHDPTPRGPGRPITRLELDHDLLPDDWRPPISSAQPDPLVAAADHALELDRDAALERIRAAAEPEPARPRSEAEELRASYRLSLRGAVREAVTPEVLLEVAEKLVSRAKAGDLASIEALMRTIDGKLPAAPPADTRVTLDLPKLDSTEACAEAAAVVVDALASGRISLAQAETCHAAIRQAREVFTAWSLEARICEALEVLRMAAPVEVEALLAKNGDLARIASAAAPERPDDGIPAEFKVQ